MLLTNIFIAICVKNPVNYRFGTGITRFYFVISIQTGQSFSQLSILTLILRFINPINSPKSELLTRIMLLLSKTQMDQNPWFPCP